MYTYKKEMYQKFKFKFNGLESIEQNYSQALQDLFVLAVLNGKRNGTFLEIGAFDPKFLSNSLLLERDFGWNGISIDISPFVEHTFKMASRTAKVIIGDATKLNYRDLVLSSGFGPRLDYCGFDIEPNTQTLECLKNFPLNDIRFTVCSYETDVYDPASPKERNIAVRKESRKIFEDFGYELIAGNLSNITDDAPFEDWYVDKDIIDDETIQRFKRLEDTPLAAHKYMGLE